jgi:hypothetical protein
LSLTLPGTSAGVEWVVCCLQLGTRSALPAPPLKPLKRSATSRSSAPATLLYALTYLLVALASFSSSPAHVAGAARMTRYLRPR